MEHNNTSPASIKDTYQSVIVLHRNGDLRVLSVLIVLLVKLKNPFSPIDKPSRAAKMLSSVAVFHLQQSYCEDKMISSKLYQNLLCVLNTVWNFFVSDITGKTVLKTFARSRRCSFEALEERQLLSVNPLGFDFEEFGNNSGYYQSSSYGCDDGCGCGCGCGYDYGCGCDDGCGYDYGCGCDYGCGSGCGYSYPHYNVWASTPANCTIGEGESAAITFHRNGNVGDLTVYFTYADNWTPLYDARYGYDYSLGGDTFDEDDETGVFSVTFEDGYSTSTITLTALDEDYVENYERAAVRLIADPNYNYVDNSGCTACGSGFDNQPTCPTYSVMSGYGIAGVSIRDNDRWEISVEATIDEVLEYRDFYGNNVAGASYGEWTITRIGETDSTVAPPVELFFVLSGTATDNVDYNIYQELSYNNGTTTWTDTFCFAEYPFYTVTIGGNQSSARLRLYTLNDGKIEGDDENKYETATLTMISPLEAFLLTGCDYTQGCTGLPPSFDHHPHLYDFVDSVGTITIRDDDHWTVTTEMVDDTATERLSEVAQDYAYFNIKRINDIDKTYGVTAKFDTIYDSSAPINSAILSGDYSLQYQDANGNWVAVTYLQTIITENSPLIRYRHQVYIPVDETMVTIRVVATFDWLDEAVLFDPNGETTPNADDGETFRYELKQAIWSGLDVGVNPISGVLTGEIEIKDGAICLIVTDSNNDSVITTADRNPELKNDPDTPGKIWRVNNDDDDLNGGVDRLQRPDDFNVAMNPAALADSAPSVTVQNEDDLAETILYVWVELLEKENGDSLYFDVYSVFPNDLVMWTAETKGSRIHRGVESNGRITEQTRLATLSKEDGQNLFTRTVYMEANASVVGTVVLIAQPVLGTPTGSGGSDSIKMTILEIDLDIDSDNNGGIYGGPSHSGWEDYIEMHTYGLGKVIVPNYGDRDDDGKLDCWDGYGIAGYTQQSHNASASFVPITISIPSNVDVTNLYINFDYSGEYAYGLSVPSSPSSIPVGAAGSIRIWKKDGQFLRLASDFVVEGYSYNVANLGFSNSQRTVTFYVEGMVENANIKYYNDVLNGAKQNTYILTQLYTKNDKNQWFKLSEDKVLYVVAAANTFYHQMAKNQVIRLEAASAEIYTRSDLAKFGLQLSGRDPLTEGGNSLVEYVNSKVDLQKPDDVGWLDWFMGTDGFNAGVYFDYTTRKSVVTFQGSDFIKDWFVDWGNNIEQYVLGTSEQYNKAMDIGFWMHDNNIINNVIFTGHSLGGGLASAAMLCAVPNNYAGPKLCYTFNAAAVYAATLQQYIQTREINDGGRVAYNYNSREFDLATAFIVRGEILDAIQTVIGLRAFGGKQQLEHNLGLESFDWTGTDLLDDEIVSNTWWMCNRISLHLNFYVIRGLEIFYGIREQ